MRSRAKIEKIRASLFNSSDLIGLSSLDGEDELMEMSTEEILTVSTVNQSLFDTQGIPGLGDYFTDKTLKGELAQCFNKLWKFMGICGLRVLSESILPPVDPLLYLSCRVSQMLACFAFISVQLLFWPCFYPIPGSFGELWLYSYRIHFWVVLQIAVEVKNR